MSEGTLSYTLRRPKCLYKALCENTLSQGISQDMQKQNTLNKIFVKNHPSLSP